MGLRIVQNKGKLPYLITVTTRPLCSRNDNWLIIKWLQDQSKQNASHMAKTPDQSDLILLPGKLWDDYGWGGRRRSMLLILIIICPPSLFTFVAEFHSFFSHNLLRWITPLLSEIFHSGYFQHNLLQVLRPVFLSCLHLLKSIA